MPMLALRLVLGIRSTRFSIHQMRGGVFTLESNPQAVAYKDIENLAVRAKKLT